MGLAEEYEEARAEEVKDRLILDNKDIRTERFRQKNRRTNIDIVTE